MTTLREAARQALEALEFYYDLHKEDADSKAITALRAALAEPEQPDCYGYASRLATHIWQKHYTKDAPQWKPLDDLLGVLTQIDNMTSGLARQKQPEQEPVALGPEWTPCVKLPVTVHVRAQRPGEAHVSTREGITPVKPDDLIMRGVSGEEYPIGREIFESTYRLGPAPTPRKPEQEPVAWMHNLIADNIITHQPADLTRHLERWTALYPAPQPCPTCVALSRTVMMDQTSHDTAPTPRKPLTEEEMRDVCFKAMSYDPYVIARAIERAHGITNQETN